MEPAKTPPQSDAKLHFLDYWRIIRIRKVIILAVFLLVVITTTAVTFVLPQSYSSTARLKIEKDTPDITPFGMGSGSQVYDPYFLTTEFEVLKSRKILDPVIQKLKLNEEYSKRNKLNREYTTQESYDILSREVEVKQFRNTSIIEVTASSPTGAAAAEIANAVALSYEEYRNSLRSVRNERGLGTLTNQLAMLDVQAKAKAAEVDRLKLELKIPDIVADGGQFQSLSTDEIRRESMLKTDIESRLNQEEIILKNLKAKSGDSLRHALNATKPTALLQQLLSDLSTAQVRKISMNPDLGPEHPEVKRINDVLATINTQIDEQVKGIMESLTSQVESDRDTKIKIEETLAKARDEDAKAMSKYQPYRQLKKELETLDRVRQAMQAAIMQENVSGAISKQSSVEVIDTAIAGLHPVKPAKALNITLGAIAGLLLGVGLAFFIEYLDTSVKTIDDVEQALQAPVLGVIPQNVGTLINEGPESPHAEAYRVLRTNVLFSRKDPSLRTMTVVSGGAGEGKSTTIFNLATIFAQQGSRVLIVDSDLRRPSLHKLLNVANTVGLTNNLLKQNKLEEVIQTTNLPSMDFLPSGKLPSSSMGILNSAAMRAFIEEAKSRYDFVFFDSPPIMGVSDASILASEVDMAILVVQYRKYPQQMTLRAKQMVEKVGGKLLGVVLNNINISQDSYYYYYSGYYYDYYSKSEDSRPDGEKKAVEGKGSKSKSGIDVQQKY